jgi:hypothetical protein
VDRIGEKSKVGSGYLVSPGWVLTARHVVQDAASVAVWLGAPPALIPEEGIGVDLRQVLTVAAVDLALLPVGKRVDDPSCEQALLGRLTREPGEPVPVAAAGCPRFKLRPAPARPDVLLRDLTYAIGSIAELSNSRSGGFAFTVDVAPGPDPEPNKHSPWEGMSGAAVWASNRLIGVVAQHHPGDGLATLTVCPVEQLFERASASELEAWCTALPQLPAAAEELWLATPPTVRKIEEERTRQAVEALAPRVMIGRSDDLAALEAFTGSDRRWWWIQADAFAGKTALLAWFTLHPPERVDVVACFLRRAGGANTANNALRVLNRQLVLLADQPGYPEASSVLDRVGDFYDLLGKAARASAERERKLVVLIDGLDEYDPTASNLDLADWLPDGSELPDQAKLVADSRAGADISLPPRHPLLGHVHRITASEVATEIQDLAREEIKRALTAPGGFISPIVGCLAVADGGLTASELQVLLKLRGRDADVSEIQTLLSSSLGRSLMRLPDPDVPSAPGSNSAALVFVFAHETLLTEARQEFAGDLAAYEDRFDQWADEYVQQDWPVDTPRYLLRPYTRELAQRARELPTAYSRGEPAPADRLATIAADGARHDRMAERTLGDAAALDEIVNAQQLYLAQPQSDLTRFALLAIERQRLTLRNQALPPGLPALWVKLGQPHRGQELAGSLTGPSDRAIAMAEMACALADANQRDQAALAAQDAEKATRSITDASEQATAFAALAAAQATAKRFDQAEQAARKISDRRRQARALATLAASLANAGQFDEAKRVALSIRDPGDHTEQLAALAAALASAGQLEEATEYANRALLAARSVQKSLGFQAMLADLGTALAKAGLLDLAGQVADSIRRDARQRVKALVAIAVYGKSDQAARAVHAAEEDARSIESPDDQAEALAEVVGALAAVGRLERATETALAIKNPRHQAEALTIVAAALTAGGQLDQAAWAIHEAELAARSISDSPQRAEVLAALATALVAGDPDQAGQFADQAELAARSISDPERAEVLAVALSIALASAGQLDEAQRVTHSIATPRRKAEALAALAAALTTAGQLDRAEQVALDAERAARGITSPDDQVEALIALTTALATSLPGDAEQIALRIPDPSEQARVLAALAATRIAAGEADQAEQIVCSITDPGAKAKALAALVGAFFVIGQPDEGERIARKAEDTIGDIVGRSDKDAALAALATALGASQPHRAEELARNISNPRARAETLAQLAAELADTGQLEQAEGIVRSLRTAYPRVHADALATLAATLYAANQPDPAEQVAEDALQAARNIPYRSAQAAALATLAAVHSSRGQQGEAEQITRDAEQAAGGITDLSGRAEALARLAAALATVGQLDQAERVAHNITDPKHQAQALADVAAALATVGRLDQAERVAYSITDPKHQAQALLQIASFCERTNVPEWTVRANHICGLVLTTSSWYSAFLLLSKLDPQSLIAVFKVLSL